MILHIDMDAFFASVEQKTDPRLRGKPVLVCGDPGTRSVVAAASYEARPNGVHAGMPVDEAVRRCPYAVLGPGNPSKYVSLSHRLFELFREVSPLLEPVSIDEAFLDLRGTPHDGGGVEALAAAQWIQREVRARHDLGCSVGIGPNKLVAKMAAGVDKPSGITLLDIQSFRQRFWGREVGAMWGIGEKTVAALATLGIRSVHDLAHADRGLMSKTFGINGPRMIRSARGEDQTPLIPYFQGIENKSMGHEYTVGANLDTLGAIDALLLRLSDQVTRRMRQERYWGRVVTIKIRDARFRTVTRQRVLREFTQEPEVVYRVSRALIRENWRGEPLRLLGISLSQLHRVEGVDPGLLFEIDRQRREMTRSVDAVRDRFGEDALRPAASYR